MRNKKFGVGSKIFFFEKYGEVEEHFKGLNAQISTIIENQCFIYFEAITSPQTKHKAHLSLPLIKEIYRPSL